MSTIKNFEDLCSHFGADEPAGLNRRIYKDTGCGASISVRVVNPTAIQVEGDTLTLQLQVRENAYVPYKHDEDTDEAHAKKVEEFKGLYVLSLNHGIYSHGPNCYFTDTLRSCHEGAFWFDEFYRRAHLEQLHFVCNYHDPMSFWPAVPRRGEPVTIETLKAEADGHVEICGVHHFQFIFKKPKTATTQITVSGRVARRPNGKADLRELRLEPTGHWRQPEVFRSESEEEPWLKGVMEFFDVGHDTPFKQIKDQTWSAGDRVDVTKLKGELLIRKTFLASDRCYGWKVYPEQNEIWAHNGSELWNHITSETKLLGFTIQSIVEGSDATVDSSEFVVPVEAKEVDDWIQEMEDETSRIWKAANTYLYEVVTKKKQTNYYVRLNWGDVEWEDEVPPKKLKEKVEKYLKEIKTDDLRTDLDGEAGFSLRYCEEPEYMY